MRHIGLHISIQYLTLITVPFVCFVPVGKHVRVMYLCILYLFLGFFPPQVSRRDLFGFDLSRKKLCRAFISVSLFCSCTSFSVSYSTFFLFYGHHVKFLHRKRILQWCLQLAGDVTRIHGPSSSLRCLRFLNISQAEKLPVPLPHSQSVL